MAQPLDQIDLQILHLLSRDGRMSCSEIARSIGHITARSIRYRLERLRAKGILRVQGQVMPGALGFPVTALILVYTEPGKAAHVARKLESCPAVTFAACQQEDNLVFLQAAASDLPALDSFICEQVEKTEGVQQVTRTINPEIIKDPSAWQIPEQAVTPPFTSS
ncbi:MAG TPA: Lrp/AsnC family transcriptional regulator [Chloroflexi bacterium]|jgi:DNA-binding Lrp family transcriptional regulator|nr:Lrp/AsnC family transcriptional regulator [Chloroflexota bacterium]HPO57640.1 Lrp/AsnC family transcriptional regulator [Anaerolineaceae bacterium]